MRYLSLPTESESDGLADWFVVTVMGSLQCGRWVLDEIVVFPRICADDSCSHSICFFPEAAGLLTAPAGCKCLLAIIIVENTVMLTRNSAGFGGHSQSGHLALYEGVRGCGCQSKYFFLTNLSRTMIYVMLIQTRATEIASGFFVSPQEFFSGNTAKLTPCPQHLDGTAVCLPVCGGRPAILDAVSALLSGCYRG